jgi:NADPH:quinone reductase-like Zn-dependent oxidoreductase
VSVPDVIIEPVGEDNFERTAAQELARGRRIVTLGITVRAVR